MASHLITIELVKTYATEANAIKAAEKAGEGCDDDLRYFTMKNEAGRYGVVFIGEVALHNMIHFKGFNIIA